MPGCRPPAPLVLLCQLCSLLHPRVTVKDWEVGQRAEAQEMDYSADSCPHRIGTGRGNGDGCEVGVAGCFLDQHSLLLRGRIQHVPEACSAGLGEADVRYSEGGDGTGVGWGYVAVSARDVICKQGRGLCGPISMVIY